MADLTKEVTGAPGAEAVALANKAVPLINSGRYAEALELLDKALKLYSYIKTLQYLRAFCLHNLNRASEAKTALEREVAAFGGSPQVSALLISVLADPNRELSPKELMRRQELHVYSQNGEDGILLYLFSKVGTTNRTFVEFGTGNGMECNTANLSFNWGWRGLLLEGNTDDVAAAKQNYAGKPVTVAQAFITAGNIDELIGGNGITGEIDLLSVDIDGNDLWLWKAITVVNPRVVIVEYNASLGRDRSITIPYKPDFDRNDYPQACGAYHGASLPALAALGRQKGYILAGCDSNGCNAFFVRSDVAEGTIAELSPAHAYYPHIYRTAVTTLEKQLEYTAGLPFVEI